MLFPEFSATDSSQRHAADQQPCAAREVASGIGRWAVAASPPPGWRTRRRIGRMRASAYGFPSEGVQESRNPRASVWDVLSLPTGDVRGRPYEERRALMLDMVAGLPEGSPIQAVSATEDVEVARVWYETLTGSGVEGVVAKSGRSPYRAGRSSSWKKVRHAETIDAEVVGFTGVAGRPRALAVRLPDGRVALSQRLGAELAAQVAAALVAVAPAARGRAAGGESFTAVESGLLVEVLAGTTRHAVVTVTRVR